MILASKCRIKIMLFSLLSYDTGTKTVFLPIHPKEDDMMMTATRILDDFHHRGFVAFPCCSWLVCE